jgi:hypothetical protein
MYPKVVKAVGVSVKSLSSAPASIQRAKYIQDRMSDAVMECYADGEKDDTVIKARMQEAREKAELV